MLNILMEQSETEAAERRIRIIDKLRKMVEYWLWRNSAISALSRARLDKYVLGDVPEPTDSENWLPRPRDTGERTIVSTISNVRIIRTIGGDAFKPGNLIGLTGGVDCHIHPRHYDHHHHMRFPLFFPGSFSCVVIAWE